MTKFKILTTIEVVDKTELIHIEMKSGFHISIDHTYIDQVGDFKLLLPTGEVLDTSEIQ